MIAVSSPSPIALHHALFVAMLPKIRRYAGFVFRHKPRAAREEFIAEVVANAYVSFARLVERNKLDVAFPTVLARFACRQIREGRRVGNRCDVHDLTSKRAQRNGVFIHGLYERNEKKGRWEELIVEDKKTRPADVAACRVDFRAWLATLPLRNRQIAEALAVGTSTSDTAERFGVTLGRISQLRREFHEGWMEFQGEPLEEAA